MPFRVNANHFALYALCGVMDLTKPLRIRTYSLPTCPLSLRIDSSKKGKEMRQRQLEPGATVEDRTAAESSGLRCTVDFQETGKHLGMVWVPNSADNESGWGNFGIPICSINSGSGLTVLAMAGTHGDEYESQLALHRIIAETTADEIHGRLIVIPSLSQPAAAVGTRLWPDGTNLNRAFPGQPSGSAPAQLAWYLNEVLFQISDVVCDFHTGGRSLAFRPMATLHLVDDPIQRKRMVEAAVAMGTGVVLAYTDINGVGLLPTAAETLGRIVVSAELGGGGLVTASAVTRTACYVRNVLRHFGLLVAHHPTDSPRMGQTKALRSTTVEDYVLSPCSGLYEPLVDLDAKVAVGDVLGRIHSLEGSGYEPLPVVARSSGVLAGMRAITTSRPGDCLAMVGQESTIADLITWSADVSK